MIAEAATDLGSNGEHGAVVVRRLGGRPGHPRAAEPRRRPATGGAACTGRRWRSTRSRAELAIDPQRSAAGSRDAADRRAGDARNQLSLLRNEDSDHGQTDFYSYRYLASEGFLPGYSFPRLPLAAYIPGGRSRPRDDATATTCNGLGSWRSASSAPVR